VLNLRLVGTVAVTDVTASIEMAHAAELSVGRNFDKVS